MGERTDWSTVEAQTMIWIMFASSWHGPLLFPAYQKPSHPWCRSLFLPEAVRSFPQSHLWPLVGSHPSLHCSLAINHTLTCDISCIALSCYLSLVYSFTFLAFMSYLFKLPESTEHIFGILFSPSVPCLLVIAAL